jgi:hypothetical protein
MPPPSRSGSSRSARALRILALAVIAAVAVAYVQPLRAYRHAEDAVGLRKAEIQRLERANAALERRLSVAGTDEFIVREARKLGLVRPGERLFIVKGVRRAGLR